MNDVVFYYKSIQIEGLTIPDLNLRSGHLIRIYIPNFDSRHIPLGFDLTIELVKRFQKQDKNLPWAINYSQHSVLEFFRPLTVERYLKKIMRINDKDSWQICKRLAISPEAKLNYISCTLRMALIIKALFYSNDSIIMHYYGISAEGITFLETIVNEEIEKGKSAIAFDRLEFKQECEPFDNICPVIIDLDRN